MIVSPKFHFLVVDDQDIIRSIVVALLNTLGYSKVSEAADGKTALQLLQTDDVHEAPINFVISDWNMPRMDGLALLKTIRATETLQHLPVLMVTSVGGETRIAAAIKAGADGYINKDSLDVAILKSTIENIVKKRGLAE